MRVIIAGGGTAGHINPALAILETIKKHKPDTEILYVGARGGMECRLIPEAGYPFRAISVKGFQRKLTPVNVARNIKAVVLAGTSQIEARTVLSDFKPDLVIGTGGYVSGPVLLAAAKRGIKTAIHESNAYPGMTTKILSSKVDLCLLAVEKARMRLPDALRCEVVGNPVRADLLRLRRDDCRKALNLGNRKLVVSFGGSLGAEPINRAIAEVMEKNRLHTDILHIHGTGRAGYDAFLKELRTRGINEKMQKNIEVREYLNNMPELMCAADVIISRAGALTLSEIEAAGRASILIPSPYVSENHQYYNAMVLKERGAAIVIEEKDLTGSRLAAELGELLSDEERLRRYSAAAAGEAILDAGERIYALLSRLMAEKA